MKAPGGSTLFAGLVSVALTTAGCGAVFRQVAPPDDLHGWSSVPLAPDDRLASAALSSSVCRMGEDTAPPPTLVLQDRRTASSAAFLVSGPNWSGSCLVTTAGGNSGGGGQGGPQSPLTAPLGVDERTSGGFGSGTATLLGGRAAESVATVQVFLPSGQVVNASLADGHWLSWWPGDIAADRVVALDASGVVLLTLTDTTPGYQQK